MKKIKILLFFVLSFCFIITSVAQEENFEKGEVLVQFKKSSDPIAFIRKFEAETELGIRSFECLSAIVNIYKIELDNVSEDLDYVISRIYRYQDVINAQKNHFITSRETIPTDTLFNQQWFHKNTGQTGGTPDADTDVSDAWDITTGGTSTHNDTIVVCIIESGGVDISHVDLKDNIWKNYAEIPNDGIDNDNNGYVDDVNGWNVSTLDDAVGSGSHGTRVAGMIGAKGNNTTGVSGVNWDVKMMIIKGQNASNEATVIAAYNYPLIMRKKYNDSYGEEGAFVVATNASWGIDNGDPANSPLWCAMYDSLGQYGILNIAATTNNNVNVDDVGDLPTACPSEFLIGVTMTNSQDDRAGSGYGPTHVDLGAPGSGVLLTAPSNSYTTSSGTSFASPCVAGAVALAYSSPCADFINYAKFNPSGAALDMRNYILSSVDPLTTLSGEVGSGGRLNINTTIGNILSDCSTNSCISPYSLRENFITDTTAQFSWGGFSTDYLFYIQKSGEPVVEIALINQDSIFFDTLTPCASYSVWVKAICGADTSDVSYPLHFITDGCCNNPVIYNDYVTPDSLNLYWNPVLYATAYDFRYRKEGDVSWIQTFTDTVSPLLLNGLDTCATYEFQIKTICTDSTHGFSNSYFYATRGCGACYDELYCSVAGANTNSEWIEKVTINGASSQTGNNGGWYQSDTILLGFKAGETYDIKIVPGYSGFNFSERISIWVDVDHNGQFDPSDKLLNDQSTNDSLISTISIPLSTPDGITKIRIGMNALENPVACPPGTSFFGEYEDYCVYIGEDAGILSENNTFHIYPNPASEQLYIKSTHNIESVIIYTLDGKNVSREGAVHSIDISSLSNGVYLIEVLTDGGSSIQKFIKQ
ncbi:MAG: S8 family serine peptidase [Crocinitomicaceae bacterium]